MQRVYLTCEKVQIRWNMTSLKKMVRIICIAVSEVNLLLKHYYATRIIFVYLTVTCN
jgi:hypothetical protein